MVVIMETTKMVNSASHKLKEAMSLIEEAVECIHKIEDEDYSERRDSIRMRGKFGRPSYRHEEYDEYDELPRRRMY